MPKAPTVADATLAAGFGEDRNKGRAQRADGCRDVTQRLRARALALAMACPALVLACGSCSTTNDEADGEVDGMKGDWADATPLFEKAYVAHPDAYSEFNLATAYQNSGQNQKAVALYEMVVIDGYYSATHLLAATGGTAEQNPGIFLSDEATNRLALMASRKALLDQLALASRTKALPVNKVLVCDFPDRNGNGASRLGQIIVYVDDTRHTASTLGFFLTAADQQQMERFDSDRITWTQSYQIVGRTNVYHYAFNRLTGALDVTRPFPDTSKEVKVTANCRPPKRS